jgi:hypothetical protein
MIPWFKIALLNKQLTLQPWRLRLHVPPKCWYPRRRPSWADLTIWVNPLTPYDMNSLSLKYIIDGPATNSKQCQSGQWTKLAQYWSATGNLHTTVKLLLCNGRESFLETHFHNSKAKLVTFNDRKNDRSTCFHGNYFVEFVCFKKYLSILLLRTDLFIQIVFIGSRW